MLNKFFRWIYLHLHSMFTWISIALFNTEMEILKADPNINDESKKQVQRHRHRNEIIEKFYAGQRDEKYVQDYYEILKKADEFLIKSTPLDRAISADKHSRTFQSRGRENETQDYNEVLKEVFRKDRVDVNEFGFYDEKHKYYGKTMEEVIELEFEERRTKDDKYEIIYIFNNKPIEAGLFDSFDVVEKENAEIDKKVSDKVVIENALTFVSEDGKEFVAEIPTKSKQLKFPLGVYREGDVVNKIEELTEFLHIKKTAFEGRILEFFIPAKFKTKNFDIDSDVFKDITNIKEVFFKDEYGNLYSFSIKGYRKRVDVNNIYDVIKFDATEMEVYTSKN